jgi:hypothetical protein
MIVGINGVSESGKDSIGQICINHWNCKRLAFADRMKECALAIDPWIPIDPALVDYIETRGQIVRLSVMVSKLGWDEAKKNPEVRRFLQRLGTDAGRNILAEDLWVRQLTPLIKARPSQHFVITDVRFLNEAEMIRNRGGVVVRVTRPGYGPAQGHISDVHDQSLWDEIIHNNGTLEELEETTVAILGKYFDAS